MKCPVELAHEVSAWQAVRVGDHGKHGALLRGRGGAGDEGTGSDLAGGGEEDHLTQVGRALRELGIQMIPRLLAASARA